VAEGYKDWAAGDVLTAADLEDYTVKQSVMRFADAAARDTALTSVVTEGMTAYLKDVDTLTTRGGSAWENLAQIGAWRSWTPSLTASTTNPTLGTASRAEGIYVKVGRLVVANFVIEFGTSGTNAGSGFYRINLPVNAAQQLTNVGDYVLGDVRLFNFGPNEEARVQAIMNSVGLLTMSYPDAWPVGTFTSVGDAAPWAWGASDSMRGQLIYEAAS
jgi:hypothetical protein